MNLHKIGRTAKVLAVSAAMVLGLASCTLDYTVGYVYMTTNKSNPGLIDQYAIDFDTGALSQIGTPVAAGNDPVTLVASPSGKFVYVINQGDSTVQEFAVQGDGTLASKNVYPVTGTRPTALAIDPQGAFLYVTYTYQTGFSATKPGPGGVSIFPVNTDNSLGTPSNQNAGNNPVGVTVSYFNHFVYVLDQETEPNAKILGFSQNTTTGALTPLAGTSVTATSTTGYAAGRGTQRNRRGTDLALCVCDGPGGKPTDWVYGVAVRRATGDGQWTVRDRTVSGEPDHRSNWQLIYVVNYNGELDTGLHDQWRNGHSFGRGRFVCHGDRHRPDLRGHRSRAGDLPVHLEQPGQHGHGGETESEHWRIADGAELAVQQLATADLPDGCA